MLLPPGQKHFTVYVVSSLFSSVSVLYAVLKNSNCNRSSYFTLKWSSFTTAALYLLCLYLRYTQSHLTGCIYFFKFRRQIFFWLCPGVKSISWVLFQGSLFLPHRNTSPLLQALGFLALLIRNAQPIRQWEYRSVDWMAAKRFWSFLDDYWQSDQLLLKNVQQHEELSKQIEKVINNGSKVITFCVEMKTFPNLDN